MCDSFRIFSFFLISHRFSSDFLMNVGLDEVKPVFAVSWWRQKIPLMILIFNEGKKKQCNRSIVDIDRWKKVSRNYTHIKFNQLQKLFSMMVSFLLLMLSQTELRINLLDFSICLSNRSFVRLWRLLVFCWIVMKSKCTSVFWPELIFRDKKQLVNFWMEWSII